jgi:hypothetical protein
MNTIPASTTLFGPACAVPGYRTLGAGAVTVQGPSVSSAQAQVVPYQQGQLGGLTAYEATLAAGAVQAGTYTVSASGGADLGAFQSSVNIGPDIDIQTSLAGIDAFSNCQPLTINWTGGDPKSWITLSFVQQAPDASGGFQTINAIDRTHTSSGTMTIPYPFPLVVSNGATKCVTNAHPVTIAIEIDPDPSEIGSFSAAGLSLGGRSTWKFVHTFQATIEVP